MELQPDDLDGLFDVAAPLSRTVEIRPKTNDAKRSIAYMTKAALQWGKVQSLADLLERVVRLHVATGYSPFNALLVLLQRPAATFVLPAHRWQEQFGHAVRPGEQPLVLLQPGGPVMFLFDVSQVEPGAHAVTLPIDLRNPYAMAAVADPETALHWITDNAKYDGVRVSSSPIGLGFAGCVQRTESGASQQVTVRRRPLEKRDVSVLYDVELNRSHSSTERLATLAHELGHLYCGHLGEDRNRHWKSRAQLPEQFRELEAESVAVFVFKTLAPEATLPAHLAQYWDHPPPLEAVPLDVVLKAAGRVLNIAGGWGPQWESDRRRGKGSAA